MIDRRVVIDVLATFREIEPVKGAVRPFAFEQRGNFEAREPRTDMGLDRPFG